MKHRPVGRAVRVEPLAIHAVAVAVERLIGPHDHEAGVGTTQPCNAGLRLVHRALPSRVGTGFTAQSRTAGVEALEEHIAQFGESGVVVVVVPRHHEAAVGGCCHGRLVLALARRRVDEKLAAGGQAVGVVALAINAPARPILPARLPRHHVPAGGQASHARRLLRIGCVAVDLELAADGCARGIEALTVHPVAGPVLAVRLPHGDVASTDQLGARGITLGVGPVRVDGLVAEQSHDAIGFGGHIDRHRARLAGAAIAVADADADGAAADRRRCAVGIGQRLDHRLDASGGCAGVELQHQIASIQAAGYHTADHDTAITDGVAHRIAGGADLAGGVARAADGEAVLSRHVLGQLGIGDVPFARNDTDPQPAAVEIGRITVGQPHAAVNQLRGGIDQVLAESHARNDIEQHRRRRLAQRSAGTEKLVIDAVGAGGASTLQPEARPGDDEIRTRQAGDVGLVLRAGHRGVGKPRAIDLVAAGIELLVHHIPAAAA